MNIVFKNGLESEFVKNAMTEHMEHLQEKYPELENTEATVTLRMENSPLQAGADSYTVKIRLNGGRRIRGVSLQKRAKTFYEAVNNAFHSMARKVSKKISKRRTINRNRRRQFKHELEMVGA